MSSAENETSQKDAKRSEFLVYELSVFGRTLSSVAASLHKNSSSKNALSCKVEQIIIGCHNNRNRHVMKNIRLKDEKVVSSVNAVSAELPYLNAVALLHRYIQCSD